jgi:two-component system sensor histidine kinase EvgS
MTVGASLKRMLRGVALKWAWLPLALGAAAATANDAPLRQLPDPADVQQQLSPESRAWLRAHPTLRVATVREWPPIDQYGADGRYEGASAEMLRATARLLGVKVSARPFDNFEQVMTAVRLGEVDLVTSIARSWERESELHFSIPYLSLPVAYIGRRGTTDFSERFNFGGRSLAVERSYVAQSYLESTYPGTRLLKVDNTLQALQAVAEGRADFYLGALPPAHYLIESHRLADLEVMRTTRLSMGNLHFAATAAPLRDAVDVALRAMGSGVLDEIAASWQPRYLALTPQRLSAYGPRSVAAQTLGELRVAFDVGFGPVTYVGEDGEAAGFAVEMFRRVADAAGLRYRFVAMPSFQAGMHAVRDRQADVMLAAVRTFERLEFSSFVGPYYSAPSVLVSRLDGGWPSVASLGGHTLAVDAGHYLIPVIRREAPAVRILETGSVEHSFEAVRQGQADAAVTNLEVAARLINARFLGKLQVTGTVEGKPSELYFMLRNDQPALAAALKQGFDVTPENERHALANTWLRTEYRPGVSWWRVAAMFGPLFAALLVALLAMAFYNRRLKAQVQARERAEQALAAERDMARQATLAKAEFLAEMGHEVRTPLGAIAGGLKLLERESLPESASRTLGSINRAAQHLVELLNNLLDAAKLEARKIEMHVQPLDVCRLVGEVIEEFEPLAQSRGVKLSAELPQPPLPAVMLDGLRARQVLANLVSNAIKFTPPGGSVATRLQGQVVGSGHSGAPVWELFFAVRDTGVGMGPEVRERMFQRFMQAPGAEQRFGGSGLGLSIVRQLLDLVGGSIEVDSEPGRGSEFRVRVCVSQARAAVAQAGDLQLHKVLLVEDDAVNQTLFGEELRARGYEVIVVGAAEEALQVLRERPVDLLITDLNLPGQSGLELASAVQALGPARVPKRVVVLSGEDAPPGGAAIGVDLWLTKPRGVSDRGWLSALRELR